MAVVKKGLQVTEVMVQEGVYTFERVNEAVAEPVIYMIDPFVVGRIYGCILAAVSMKTLMRRECSSYRSLSKIRARCRIGMPRADCGLTDSMRTGNCPAGAAGGGARARKSLSYERV